MDPNNFEPPESYTPSCPYGSGGLSNSSSGEGSGFAAGGGDYSEILDSKEGWDLQFVPNRSEKYDCPICLLVLREPMQTECGHRFCKACILKWLRESESRCPIDNCPLDEKQLFPDNFAKREILALYVKCPNHVSGCDVVVVLKNLQEHHSLCEFSYMPCPQECADLVRRCDLQSHLSTQCPKRTISCPLCGLEVEAEGLQSQSSGSENVSNGSRASTDSAISGISSRSSTSRDPSKNQTSSKNRNSRNTPNRCKSFNTTRSKLDKVSGKKVSKVDPSEHTQQMVEIFRPQLEGSIRAREIISYLPFIVDDRETILLYERESPRAAMSRLLDRIAQSEEKGKWTTFLDALKTVGYQYIANLLTGKTEGDTTNQIRLVRILEPDIIHRMDTATFLDHLYQDGVIGDIDKEEVECEQKNRGPMAANLRLIELMPSRLEHWFHAFIGTMRKCGMSDVADAFESSEVCRQSVKETRDTFDTTCSEETSTKTIYPDTSDDDNEISYIHPENGYATEVNCSAAYRSLPPLPPVSTELRTSIRLDLEGDATAVKYSKKHPNLPPLPPVPTEIQAVHTQETIEHETARNTVKCDTSSRIGSLMAQEAALYKQLNEVKLEKELERKIKSLTRKIDSLSTQRICLSNCLITSIKRLILMIPIENSLRRK